MHSACEIGDWLLSPGKVPVPDFGRRAVMMLFCSKPLEAVPHFPQGSSKKLLQSTLVYAESLERSRP